jgi:tetratricopeptide (TPR) repeat protein
MLGRYDDALALYRRSAQGFERLVGADTARVAAPLGNAAEALVRQGRPADAILNFERLLATSPNGALWDGLAQARRSLGDHAGAVEAFARAAEVAETVKLPPMACSGRVGVVEELLALGREAELPGAGPRQRGLRHRREGDGAGPAGVHARLRERAGDRHGAEAAMVEAEALVAGAAPDSPGARLAAELAAWRGAHRQ